MHRYLSIIHIAALCVIMFMQGCAFMPHSGPSKRTVERIEGKNKADETPQAGILVKVDDTIAKRLKDSHKIVPFTTVFGESEDPAYQIGPGDVIEVTIWETPPGVLFKNPGAEGALIAMGTGAEALPAQMVMEDGTITVPFAGRVKVTGRNLASIEREIANRLAGQANKPQVLVRVAGNSSSNVTVIGDVKQSLNMPLTPRGERLLDALAKAGGVNAPLNKVSLQLSRKGVNGRMPLDQIVDNPEQNLQLMPGDIVAALHQPWSFSILGAAGTNREVPFEASGISLAQALSRSGGLNDFRADPGGVFIFRFENAKNFPDTSRVLKEEETIPVVYQVNFNEPETFFVIQNFPMQDKDVMYIANMPAAELQKFMQMVGMLLSPALSIGRYQIDATQ